MKQMDGSVKLITIKIWLMSKTDSNDSRMRILLKGRHLNGRRHSVEEVIVEEKHQGNHGLWVREPLCFIKCF